MTDLVQRLRDRTRLCLNSVSLMTAYEPDVDCQEAADRIEQLERKLREATSDRHGLLTANANLRARVAALEKALLEYWDAKDWGAVGAADSTAAKLLPADMKKRPAQETKDE